MFILAKQTATSLATELAIRRLRDKDRDTNWPYGRPLFRFFRPTGVLRVEVRHTIQDEAAQVPAATTATVALAQHARASGPTREWTSQMLPSRSGRRRRSRIGPDRGDLAKDRLLSCVGSGVLEMPEAQKYARLMQMLFIIAGNTKTHVPRDGWFRIQGTNQVCSAK